MAAVDALSFDFLQTSDLANGILISNPGWRVIADLGRRGTGHSVIAPDNGAGAVTAWRVPVGPAPSGSKVVCHIAFKIVAGNARAIFKIASGATIQATIYYDSGNRIALYRGDTATLLATGTTPIAQGTWYSLLWQYTIDDAAGASKGILNGITQWDISGQDTKPDTATGWDRYGFVHTGNLWDTYFCDVVLCDGTAGEFDDVSTLGDCRTDAHDPDANGGNSDWTRSTGADDYALLDESPANGDTDYIETSTVGHRTTVGVENFVASGNALKFVNLFWYVKKTDAGSASVGPCLRRNATNHDGTGQAVLDAYAYANQAYGTDPEAAGAWTEANYNATEFGPKRTA